MNEDASRVDFIELIFPATDDFGFDERDKIEDALDSALSTLAIGHVSGAGAGMGVLELSIDVDEQVIRIPVEQLQKLFNPSGASRKETVAGKGVIEAALSRFDNGLDGNRIRHEPERVIAAVLEVVRTFGFSPGSYLLAYPTSLQPVDL